MAPIVYVPSRPDLPLVDVAESASVSSLTLSRLEPGFTSDWHPAPRRQYVVVLAGEAELMASDGETRRFGPGAFFLVEDTTGDGHQTRAIGSSECLFATAACE